MTLLEPKLLKRRYDPSLIVNRLRIERNGRSAYDECFHRGVNILRGENASGKSTILNFIFYGLGGDLADWSEAASLCTHVYIEVTVNGNIATLCREIATTSKQPMDLYAGPMEDALVASKAEWARYPYSRSQSVESFSQTIFRLMGVPEVKGGGSETVTIHQLLRLLYADQLSPVESIFKFERFDPPTLREAVGRLLCGAYDNEMYENELRIRQLDKEWNSVNAELRSLIAVLGSQGEGMTLDWVNAERQVLLQRRDALRQEIEATERQRFETEKADELTLKSQRVAYESVQRLQSEILSAKTKVSKLEFSIADSNDFIESLERKLSALKDATSVADYIVEVHFDVCPACLAKLQSQDKDAAACHLCRTSFDSERAKGRLVALINDTALQLRQSRSLQTRRMADLEKTKVDLLRLESQWMTASERLADLTALPSGAVHEAMRELNRRSGYLEREIEDLEKRTSIAMMIEELSTRKATLNADISRLKTENEARAAAQQKQLQRAYNRISSEIVKILQGDLPRQDSFIDAKKVDFDFGANQISVDGHRYFSASSRVILKSGFYVGFISAALKEPSFRHPRFCIIDTIEDKGMEVTRSHNFQHLIANISAESDVQHQIIFATAMISPELDDESYTVGKFSTREDPTLNLKVLAQ